jgi:hypothetical protein
MRRRRTSGVWPIDSRMDSWILLKRRSADVDEQAMEEPAF